MCVDIWQAICITRWYWYYFFSESWYEFLLNKWIFCDGRQTRWAFFAFPKPTAWFLGYLYYNSSPPIFDIVMSLRHSKWRQITVIGGLGEEEVVPRTETLNVVIDIPQDLGIFAKFALPLWQGNTIPINRSTHLRQEYYLALSGTWIHWASQVGWGRGWDALNEKNPIRKQIHGAVVNFDGPCSREIRVKWHSEPE